MKHNGDKIQWSYDNFPAVIAFCNTYDSFIKASVENDAILKIKFSLPNNERIIVSLLVGDILQLNSNTGTFECIKKQSQVGLSGDIFNT
jgi:hypothetical protein